MGININKLLSSIEGQFGKMKILNYKIFDPVIFKHFFHKSKFINIQECLLQNCF